MTSDNKQIFPKNFILEKTWYFLNTFLMQIFKLSFSRTKEPFFEIQTLEKWFPSRGREGGSIWKLGFGHLKRWTYLIPTTKTKFGSNCSFVNWWVLYCCVWLLAKILRQWLWGGGVSVCICLYVYMCIYIYVVDTWYFSTSRQYCQK